MIISRYLAKEVLYTMIAITAIVVFIFICNQFVRYLGFVASGKYAANMLIYIVLLQIPVMFGLLLPLGLFLGILMGYGRLYADSEMTVLSACGFGRKQLLIVTLKFSVIVALVVAILVMWAGPLIAKKRDFVVAVAESGSIFQTVLPGRFQSTLNGKRVFYIQDVEAGGEGQMNNVFLAQQLDNKEKGLATDAQKWMIVSAKGGHQMTDKETGVHFMVADDGYRYEGVPGQKDYSVVKYKSYGVLPNVPVAAGTNEGEEVVSTTELFKKAWHLPRYMAELQWRLSFPISVFILVLLAVPLSRVNPRQGRFAQLFPAILIYIIYANMIFVSRNWLENGEIPWWVGMWWIHGIALLLALWLFAKQAGYRIFWKR